jgi:hypothetical protein
MPPTPRKRDPRPTLEELQAMRDAADADAKEALAHIYQAMLKLPEFTLKNGTKCRLDALSSPEVDSGGELKCAFDVMLGDRGHLEFKMAHTGWGRSFVKAEQPKEKVEGPGKGR